MASMGFDGSGRSIRAILLGKLSMATMGKDDRGCSIRAVEMGKLGGAKTRDEMNPPRTNGARRSQPITARSGVWGAAHFVTR